jgi:hypothetical protein
MFRSLHPEKATNPNNPKKRSDEWLILWRTIRDHEDGICDIRCLDCRLIQPEDDLRLEALLWLHTKAYLQKKGHYTDAWPNPPVLYQLNWNTLKQNLGVDQPSKLLPLFPEMQVQTTL